MIFARGTSSKGPATRSPIREVTVTPPAIRKANKAGAKADGLACEVTPRQGKSSVTWVLAGLGGSGQEPVAKALKAKAEGPYASIVITGEFEAPVAGLYELLVSAEGDLALEIDGKPCVEAKQATLDRQLYGLAALEAGWHAIRIHYAPTGAAELTVLLGGDVVTHPLVGKALRHSAK